MNSPISNSKIIVGIPSYLEADTIADVTKTVDEGLRKYFPKAAALIINVDNDSPDGTKKVFLSVKTKTPKRYIATPKGVRGKGHNLRNLFEFFARTKKAERLMIIDADLYSAEPAWVKKLLFPIAKGFDHSLPVYRRAKYDGSITNHLCYPVLRGLLGREIRQPIGGEMAFSRRAVENFLRWPWPKNAYKFGVDIFMTTRSLFSNLKLVETELGVREHKPSEPELYYMFEEVATTLFEILKVNKTAWAKKIGPIKKPKIMFRRGRKLKVPEVNIDYSVLTQTALRELRCHRRDIQKILGWHSDKLLSKKSGAAAPEIKSADWAKTVFAFVRAENHDARLRARALRPLYLSRFLTFCREVKNKTPQEAERLIQKQAEVFFAKRNSSFTAER